MTNAELLAKIKAEIERRIKIQDDWAGRKVLPGRDLAFAVKEELKLLLSFLDTLESEKPMNQEGLKEEIHKYNKERFDEYFPEQEGDFISEVDFMTCLDRVARHFAQWGAEHAREQMMKEAVEGEVCIPNVWVEHKEGKELVVRAEISKELGFKFGDKVRIIIIKGDEK